MDSFFFFFPFFERRFSQNLDWELFRRVWVGKYWYGKERIREMGIILHSMGRGKCFFQGEYMRI